MLNSFKNFSNNSNFLQKSLLIMFSLLPFALVFSIFVSDLFATLISLSTIIIIIKEKKVFSFFDNLKLITISMILFYTIIIMSLLNSHDLKSSFLPSFFYFRFFLMSFGIFYIIQHHKFSLYAILLFTMVFYFFLLSNLDDRSYNTSSLINTSFSKLSESSVLIIKSVSIFIFFIFGYFIIIFIQS